MMNSYKPKHRTMDLKKFQQLKQYTGRTLLITILDSKEQLSTIKKMVSGCKEMMNSYKPKHRTMDLKKFQQLKQYTGRTLLITILDSKEQLSIIKKMVFGWREKKCLNFYKLQISILSIQTVNQKKFKQSKVKLGEIFIIAAILL